ncbi:hypothetical protein ASPZODRAFT_135591 [Penicilliopsis zonata CBS 506.65]|uniref:Pentatricopeptide repeat domain-containing protein n=1 Tax=Penicilliopsis zonata CBS 506.65 TaxID=1073090 RepID=A0A1L9SAE2_9EURO|nr:hypothetical protein ASPZODRAFT_135591 [Penicilliopsis zonata CBS 506.65]OJJ44118.1 hypothetical protein ASPZODRAFT_135591 [Penicilliopsis zonata CBS 506.65]
MRPALLRLLKRPSAVSILDSLIAAPAGVEQLGFRFRCARCQTRGTQQTAAVEWEPEIRDPLSHDTPSHPRYSFAVHEITPLPKNARRLRAHNQADVCTTFIKTLGLQSEKLDYESNIGHTRDIGTRLVDHPDSQQDFALWEELLRYRQRHYGDNGILEIWKGLTMRLEEVNLPTQGEQADFFWHTFIQLGLKRDTFLKDLADYALRVWERTGGKWAGFYETIVGGFFERGLTSQAVRWHKKLQHPHLAHPNDILRILNAALTPVQDSKLMSLPNWSQNADVHNSRGARAFQKICRTVEGHQIYAPVISALLHRGLMEDAISMHNCLVKRHDHPKNAEEIQRLLTYAKRYASRSTSQTLEDYVETHFSHNSATKTASGSGSSALKSDRGSWVGEKPFKDEFGARFFATKALTFEMVVAGLRMFGVSAIGPHSLREMAIRAHGNQDILNKLKALRQAGIAISDSTFSRLLRKLAVENREILLNELLHSDQHPDVLEDVALQESFFVSHYMAQDWRQYNLTWAILGELVDVPQLLNIQFRKFIAAGEWKPASKIADELFLQGKRLTTQSVDFLVGQIVTPRRKGAGPNQGRALSPRDEVALVVQILRRVVSAGGDVHPELWIEMLKRMGMGNHWDELRECCLWLSQEYSAGQKPMTLTSRALVHPGHGDRVLEAIFNPQMQAAIVAWGFKLRIPPSPDGEQAHSPSQAKKGQFVPWVRGLVLLRELGQRGVRLCETEIRRTCQRRLNVLYGPPRHSARRINRILRRENPYGLRQVINDIHHAWGTVLLFPGLRPDRFHRLVHNPTTKMSLHRARRTLRAILNTK